jgi:hypothetical protein
MQISDIIEVTDFELLKINEILEAWIPTHTKKLLISFVT